MKFLFKGCFKGSSTLFFFLGLIASNAIAIETEEELGKKLYEDANLSLTRITSCSTCHSLDNPGFLGLYGNSPSFVDNFAMSINFPVSLGAKLFGTVGKLNTPSTGYTAFTPKFHKDHNGDYAGGLFLNGRAATLAEQAQAPILNPIEMMMPNKAALVSRLKEQSSYIQAFKDIYNIDLNQIPSNASLSGSSQVARKVDEAFVATATAIGEFEKTNLFNRFTSKYDFYLAGQARLDSSEKRGLELFNGRAGCSGCHTSEKSNNGTLPPLFTNYKYYNIGVPRNVNILKNPQPDIGLAGNPQVVADGKWASEYGKHKVMSLRNVAKTPPYMHNGIFSNLKQVVHFHNTRDTKARYGDNNTFGFGWWVWPNPEYSQNVTYKVGKLGLSNRDEDDLVNFLETLTDGYNNKKTSPWTPFVQPAIANLYAYH